MNLKDYAIMIIDKAEKAYDEKDINEAVRLLTLLSEVILDQVEKIMTGKEQ